MSSFRDDPSTAETDSPHRFSEVPPTFRRRLVNNRWSLCPRRFVIALMLFLLLLIQAWRSINVIFTLAHVIFLERESEIKIGRTLWELYREIMEASLESNATSQSSSPYELHFKKIRYPSIGHWTETELDNMDKSSLAIDVFAQIPGALLIFIFSSYKYLLVSVTATSLLHMLTPVALSHHSASLLIVLIAQSVVATPINVAIMTTWKDWAPPAERTKLMVFVLYGMFVGAAATTFYPFLFHYVTSEASYYFSGLSGIIWALFWYNITSDTPQNDPLISEEELTYLECNIPPDYQHKIKIRDIPWKSIITSRQVLILCLIFFKMACSLQTMMAAGASFALHLGEQYNPLYFFIPFLSSVVVILPCSAMLADWLIRKFRGRILIIRKVFLCGGFFIQCLFMFGTLADSEFTRTIFFMIAYSIFAMSVPGFIAAPLDLSPRYVSIISGIVFTFFSIGHICVTFFAEATVELHESDSISWLFLLDGGLSLAATVLFGMWGDVEEQVWSSTFSSSARPNGYRSYPNPEDEDDLNLVSETA